MAPSNGLFGYTWLRQLLRGCFAMMFACATLLSSEAEALLVSYKARFLPGDVEAGEVFGISSAVSGDTLVVTSGEGEFGAAYVYVEPPDGWANGIIESAKLVPSDATGFGFGESVAIHGDVIVVGNEHDDTGAQNAGAAYVFVRPPGGWSGTVSESAKLTSAVVSSNDRFGHSVSIMNDTIAIGAPGVDGDAGRDSVGAVFVFERPDGGWTGSVNESAKLIASEELSADIIGQGFALGDSVAISGNVIVAGAPNRPLDLDESMGIPPPGAAYVFEKPDSTPWTGLQTESAILLPSETANATGVGESIDIDGETIASGTYRDNNGTGAVYIFERPAAVWNGTINESAKIVPSDLLEGDEFGYFVQLDGTLLAASTSDSQAHTSVDFPGTVYLFRRPIDGWVNTTEFDQRLAPPSQDLQSDAFFGTFGFGLDSGTLVIGAEGVDPGPDLGGSDHGPWQGVAYIFQTCGAARTEKALDVNEWTLISVPCQPEAPGTVESTFGDDLDPIHYATRWVMHAFDPLLEEYRVLSLDDPLEPGVGYWIISLDPGELDVDGEFVPITRNTGCVSPEGCFEIELAGPDGNPLNYQWNLLGLPFPAVDIPWADVRVVTPEGEVFDPTEAFDEGITDNHFYRYFGSDIGYQSASTAGSLNEFDAFWFYTTNDVVDNEPFPAGTKLVIPATPKPVPSSP